MPSNLLHPEDIVEDLTEIVLPSGIQILPRQTDGFRQRGLWVPKNEPQPGENQGGLPRGGSI